MTSVAPAQMQTSNAGVPDVQQTLEFRGDTTLARMLPIGLGLCFLALLVFALDDRPEASIVFYAVVILLAGAGVTAVALRRRSHAGRPLFVLSPLGIHYRLFTTKEILVPWREVHGVDTIDITTFNWSLKRPGTITFPDVTVVLLSKQFYQSHIFVPWFRRGPAWTILFIPKGSFVQFALHHELVSVEPQVLRAAVEARWHAFRGQPAGPAPSVPSVTDAAAGLPSRMPRGVLMGENPRTMSRGEAVATIAFAIGIALALTNVVGLWATPGQIATREERRKWAEEEKRRDEEMRRFSEEQKKREEATEEMFRKAREEMFKQFR